MRVPDRDIAMQHVHLMEVIFERDSEASEQDLSGMYYESLPDE